MSEYEIYSYEAFRKRTRDDIRIVDNAKLNMIDEQRMNDYLSAVKNERKNLANNVSEEEILICLRKQLNLFVRTAVQKQ